MPYGQIPPNWISGGHSFEVRANIHAMTLRLRL